MLSIFAAAQAAGTLRVRVVLTDASGVATPVPRLVLLVSDNPPTDEPRRVRTAADGTVELKLAPGSYIVELDEPSRSAARPIPGRRSSRCVPGRRRCSISPRAMPRAADQRAHSARDSATLLTAWRDSVVEIWTPTRHAAGFVIDSAGPRSRPATVRSATRPPSKCSSRRHGTHSRCRDA